MNRQRPPKPKILPRSEWNALPGGGLVYPSPLADTYYRVTAHHDAYPIRADAPLSEALQVVYDHQQQHFRQGWSDIGYHFFIAPAGTIIEGRPLNTQGAHVYGENFGNVGICVMGALHQRPATEAQLASFIALYTWLCWELNLDSRCLRGHRDYLPTECPGSLYKELPKIRREAKAILSGRVAAPEPDQPVHPTLVVNGKPAGDVLIVDGVSYLPVRRAGEVFGAHVGWNAKTKQVTLDIP